MMAINKVQREYRQSEILVEDLGASGERIGLDWS